MDMINAKHDSYGLYNSFAFGALDNSCGLLANESFANTAVSDAFKYPCPNPSPHPNPKPNSHLTWPSTLL